MKFYNEGTRDMYEVKSSSEGFELRYYHLKKYYEVSATSIDKVVDYFSEMTGHSRMHMLEYFTKLILDYKNKYNCKIKIFQGPNQDLITSTKDINYVSKNNKCIECDDIGGDCIKIPGTENSSQCFEIYKNRGDVSATIKVCYSKLLQRKANKSKKQSRSRGTSLDTRTSSSSTRGMRTRSTNTTNSY
jgi:hypothetical protein